MRLVVIGPRLTGIVRDYMFLLKEGRDIEVGLHPFQIKVAGTPLFTLEESKRVWMDGKRIRGLSRKEIKKMKERLEESGHFFLKIHEGGAFGWVLEALERINSSADVRIVGFVHKNSPMASYVVDEENFTVEELRENIALLSPTSIKVENGTVPQLIISSPKSRELVNAEEGAVKKVLERDKERGKILLALGSNLYPTPYRFALFDPNRKMAPYELSKLFEDFRNVIVVLNSLELGIGKVSCPPENSYLILKEGQITTGYKALILGNEGLTNLNLPVGSSIGTHHLGKGDRFSALLAVKLMERWPLDQEKVRDALVAAHDRLVELLMSENHGS